MILAVGCGGVGDQFGCFIGCHGVGVDPQVCFRAVLVLAFLNVLPGRQDQTGYVDTSALDAVAMFTGVGALQLDFDKPGIRTCRDVSPPVAGQL